MSRNATNQYTFILCGLAFTTAAACTSTASGPIDAEVLADAGVHADANDCVRVSRSIGPEGGELATCGATLTIPAGALTETKSFGIEPIAVPTDGLVFDFSPAATYAYHFTPDDENLGFNARIRMLHDPLDTHEHIVAVYRSPVDPDGWYPVAACEISEHESDAVVGLLGTFSTLRRNEYYPSGPVGLGSGTLDAIFNGREINCSIATSFTGFAVESSSADATRQLRLMCDGRDTSDETRITLQLSFTLNAEGVLGPVRLASWQAEGDTAMWIYSALDPSHGTPSTWSVAELDTRITGTLATELWNGTMHHAMALEFDVVPAPYRERIFDDPVCE